MSQQKYRPLSWFLAFLPLMVVSVAPRRAESNDRIPDRLRRAFETASAEAQQYARYILDRVWGAKIAVAKLLAYDPTRQRARVEALVDEAVHLVLPYGARLMQDVVFGTNSTHLRITMPDRRKFVARSGEARAAALELSSRAFDVAERELNDRLEAALTEDLEDFAQRAVEARVGIEVRGRPRGWVRSLPTKWELAT